MWWFLGVAGAEWSSDATNADRIQMLAVLSTFLTAVQAAHGLWEQIFTSFDSAARWGDLDKHFMRID